jgi:hypothetical protein
MDFEPLRDAAHPAAPRWAPVEMDREDALNCARRLIMVVLFNDITHKEQVIGSGFLVATHPELLALTATHVLTEWIDKLRPPRPHAFRGVQGDDDDFKKRVVEVVEAGLFMAAIRCRAQGGYRLCTVKGVSLPFDPLTSDVACLRLELPKWARREDFDAIPINAEMCLPGGPMLMVGWAGGEWGLPDLEGHPFRLHQHMVVRAAFNRGPVAAPRGYQNWMFLVDAPSEPGMSGGPLLVMDLLSSPGRVRLSARGVISRDCIAPPAAQADETNPNQTWVSPIEAAFTLSCPPPLEQTLFWDAVRTGMVGSYGQRARQGSVTPGSDEHSLRWDP